MDENYRHSPIIKTQQLENNQDNWNNKGCFCNHPILKKLKMTLEVSWNNQNQWKIEVRAQSELGFSCPTSQPCLGCKYYTYFNNYNKYNLCSAVGK